RSDGSRACRVSALLAQPGFVGWSLLVIALPIGLLILDRVLCFAMLYFADNPFAGYRAKHMVDAGPLRGVLGEQVSIAERNPLALCAINIALSYRDAAKSVREDVMQTWQVEKRIQLLKGVAWLNLLGWMCLLIGLAGTGLFASDAFQSALTTSESAAFEIIAERLQQAATLQAVSVALAFTAIVFAKGFGILVDAMLARADHCAKRLNLAIDGVSLEFDSLDRDGEYRETREEYGVQ
ncbi:MAG: hypothetical protein AAF420_08915, partial [Pseudomonadota bacterium]